MNNRKTGGIHEKEAAEYLVSRLAFRILTMNYYTPYGEIDIVAEDGDTLVFVEVKYRRDSKKGYALEAIGKTKQDRLRKAALFYLDKCSNRHRSVRFDCIGITGDDLRYIADAF